MTGDAVRVRLAAPFHIEAILIAMTLETFRSVKAYALFLRNNLVRIMATDTVQRPVAFGETLTLTHSIRVMIHLKQIRVFSISQF